MNETYLYYHCRGADAKIERSNRSPKFEARGTASPPLYDADVGGSVLRSRPFAVDGTLTRPITVNPEPPPLPHGLRIPGCSAASAAFTGWDVRDFDYSDLYDGEENLEETGSWNGTMWQRRSLMIEVFNPVIGFLERCTFESTVDEEGDVEMATREWMRCDKGMPPEESHEYRFYDIESYVMFNISAKSVSFNQTWWCDDLEGPP